MQRHFRPKSIARQKRLHGTRSATVLCESRSVNRRKELTARLNPNVSRYTLRFSFSVVPSPFHVFHYAVFVHALNVFPKIIYNETRAYSFEFRSISFVTRFSFVARVFGYRTTRNTVYIYIILPWAYSRTGYAGGGRDGL